MNVILFLVDSDPIIANVKDDVSVCGAEAGGVDGRVGLGFEAVEAVDECQAEVAGHVAYFHLVVLLGAVDCHGR